MDDFIPFGTGVYWILLGLLVFARGMDFLSTWLATPNLVLEANPLAKWLGWRLGLALNGVLCVVFARWPLPAVVIITTSLLVASRNFQSAWLMRTLGEQGYRMWYGQRLGESSFRLYLFCLVAQTVLVGGIGAGLMYFSGWLLVPLGVGAGIVTYAAAVFIYTMISIWKVRRY
jgi:hypothetical protein